mmetsp:Transcript_41576/g.129336  ORF Transcript_41576/g.129336 Transcript_41576/m.129336 type:complete len:201 (-) Transcript_41576:500-1102(-)
MLLLQPQHVLLDFASALIGQLLLRLAVPLLLLRLDGRPRLHLLVDLVQGLAGLLGLQHQRRNRIGLCVLLQLFGPLKGLLLLLLFPPFLALPPHPFQECLLLGLRWCCVLLLSSPRHLLPDVLLHVGVPAVFLLLLPLLLLYLDVGLARLHLGHVEEVGLLGLVLLDHLPQTCSLLLAVLTLAQEAGGHVLDDESGPEVH